MGFTIFIVFIVNAYVIGFFGGYIIDTMFGIKDTLPGADSDFAQTEDASGNIWFFTNAFYFILYAWPILGGAVWFQAMLKRGGNQSYSEYRF